MRANYLIPDEIFDIMTLQDKLKFADKVVNEMKSLRSLQKSNSKTRDILTLKKCFAQESKVDTMISNYFAQKEMLGQNW